MRAWMLLAALAISATTARAEGNCAIGANAAKRPFVQLKKACTAQTACCEPGLECQNHSGFHCELPSGATTTAPPVPTLPPPTVPPGTLPPPTLSTTTRPGPTVTATTTSSTSSTRPPGPIFSEPYFPAPLHVSFGYKGPFTNKEMDMQYRLALQGGTRNLALQGDRVSRALQLAAVGCPVLLKWAEFVETRYDCATHQATKPASTTLALRHQVYEETMDEFIIEDPIVQLFSQKFIEFNSPFYGIQNSLTQEVKLRSILLGQPTLALTILRDPWCSAIIGAPAQDALDYAALGISADGTRLVEKAPPALGPAAKPLDTAHGKLGLLDARTKHCLPAGTLALAHQAHAAHVACSAAIIGGDPNTPAICGAVLPAHKALQASCGADATCRTMVTITPFPGTIDPRHTRDRIKLGFEAADVWHGLHMQGLERCDQRVAWFGKIGHTREHMLLADAMAKLRETCPLHTPPIAIGDSHCQESSRADFPDLAQVPGIAIP